MASPIDMASLADVKAWLDVTSTNDDAVLSRLITQTSRFILSYLGRAGVLPATYVDLVRPGRRILLRNTPVVAIASVAWTGASAPLVAGSDYVVSGNWIDLLAWARCGVAAPPAPDSWGEDDAPPGYALAVSYTAGFQVSAESTVAAASLTPLAPFGPWALDAGVVNVATGQPMVKVAANPVAGQYAVSASGAYQFSATDAAASLAVLLSYGFIPAEINQACVEMVADRYRYRDRIGLVSRGESGQQTTSFAMKPIPDFVEAALQPYRRLLAPC